jgi:hypothetical protein
MTVQKMLYPSMSLIRAVDCRRLPMERLVLKDRKIFFEYHADFLKTGFELFPFKISLYMVL